MAKRTHEKGQPQRPALLSVQMRLFVAAYEGNATRAAIAAGYSPRTARQRGSALMQDPRIIDAISRRGAASADPDGLISGIVRSKIATREERQEFWTVTMNDERLPMKDRLRASDLLGRSQGDFLDRVEVAGDGGGPLTIEIINYAATDQPDGGLGDGD
jgi:phage terminase small subunit